MQPLGKLFNSNTEYSGPRLTLMLMAPRSSSNLCGGDACACGGESRGRDNHGHHFEVGRLERHSNCADVVNVGIHVDYFFARHVQWASVARGTKLGGRWKVG